MLSDMDRWIMAEINAPTQTVASQDSSRPAWAKVRTNNDQNRRSKHSTSEPRRSRAPLSTSSRPRRAPFALTRFRASDSFAFDAGGLAQLGERLAGSQKVRGSSPLSST